MPKYRHHAWTSMRDPWTLGNKEIHEEIASSQVEHWTAEQIKTAQKDGYFERLSKKCQHNTRLLLLSELCGDEEIE